MTMFRTRVPNTLPAVEQYPDGAYLTWIELQDNISGVWTLVPFVARANDTASPTAAAVLAEIAKGKVPVQPFVDRGVDPDTKRPITPTPGNRPNQ